MHSSRRTIDDMMNISDGHNPYHYIHGGMIGGMAKVDKTDLSKTEIRKGNYYGYQADNIDEEMEGNMFIRNAILNDTDDAYELRDKLGGTDEEIIKALDDEKKALYKRYETLGITPLDKRTPQLQQLNIGQLLSDSEEENEEEKTKSESENEEENEEESDKEETKSGGAKSESDEDVYSGVDTDEDPEFIELEEERTNTHGDKIVRYKNTLYIEEKKLIQDNDDYPINKKDSILGEVLEIKLKDYPNLLNYIFNNNTTEPVLNSSDENNSLYKPNFIKYVEKSNRDNKSKIKNDELKPKLDYYLCDFFIGNDELCELKCLSKSYEWYVRSGFIPLTVTKIDGDPSEFIPRYGKDASGNIMVKNIYYKPTYNSDYETTLKHDWFSYKVLYFLKDGVYYYEPLKDPHFKFNIRKGTNDATGKLDYTFTYKKDKQNNYIYQNGKKVPKEYNINPSQLKQVPKHIYNKLFKNNNI